MHTENDATPETQHGMLAPLILRKGQKAVASNLRLDAVSDSKLTHYLHEALRMIVDNKVFIIELTQAAHWFARKIHDIRT
jgi:hypothetical protein